MRPPSAWPSRTSRPGHARSGRPPDPGDRGDRRGSRGGAPWQPRARGRRLVIVSDVAACYPSIRHRRDPDGRPAGGRRARAVARAARALPRRRRSGHPDRSRALRVGGRGDPVHRGRAGAPSRHPADPLGRRRRVRRRSRRGATRRAWRGRAPCGSSGCGRTRPSAGPSHRGTLGGFASHRRTLPRGTHPPWHHPHVVKTLFRAARVHTLGHPPLGEWVLVDGRHVQRVGAGDPPAADRRRRAARVHHPARLHRRARASDERRGGHGQRRTSPPSAPAGSSSRSPRPAPPTTRSVWSRCRATTSRGGADPTLPSLAELDAVTAEPLVIRRTDGHVALVNSAALDVRRGPRHPPGSIATRSGRPTGLVTREANRQVGLWVASARIGPSHRGAAAARRRASRRRTASPRCTRWRCRSSPGCATSRCCWPIARDCPSRSRSCSARWTCPKAVELGLERDRRRPRGRRLDRGAHGRAHAPRTPTATRRASPISTTRSSRGSSTTGTGPGCRSGMHAIGDRAIEQVLRAWESVYHRLDSRERRHFRARRHRIEHFEMPTAEQIERAAMLGHRRVDAADVRSRMGAARRPVRAGASGRRARTR